MVSKLTHFFHKLEVLEICSFTRINHNILVSQFHVIYKTQLNSKTVNNPLQPVGKDFLSWRKQLRDEHRVITGND